MILERLYGEFRRYRVVGRGFRALAFHREPTLC